MPQSNSKFVLVDNEPNIYDKAYYALVVKPDILEDPVDVIKAKGYLRSLVLKTHTMQLFSEELKHETTYFCPVCRNPQIFLYNKDPFYCPYCGQKVIVND